MESWSASGDRVLERALPPVTFHRVQAGTPATAVSVAETALLFVDRGPTGLLAAFAYSIHICPYSVRARGNHRASTRSTQKRRRHRGVIGRLRDRPAADHGRGGRAAAAYRAGERGAGRYAGRRARRERADQRRRAFLHLAARRRERHQREGGRLRDGQTDGSSATGAYMSADNRKVYFASRATDLVPGDTNGADDVFVRDLVTGTVDRVSVGSDGAQRADQAWLLGVIGWGMRCCSAGLPGGMAGLPGEVRASWRRIERDRPPSGGLPKGGREQAPPGTGPNRARAEPEWWALSPPTPPAPVATR